MGCGPSHREYLPIMSGCTASHLLTNYLFHPYLKSYRISLYVWIVFNISILFIQYWIYTHLIPTVQSIKELRLSTNKHLILWLDTSMAHGTTVKLRWLQWQTNSLWKHDVKNPMFGKLVRSWVYHGLHGQKCLAFGGPISRANAAPPIRPFNSWCK